MSSNIYTKEHRCLANKLKKARIESALSQLEAARKLGKSQSYISKIESGQRNIDVMQLKELARLYEKDINFFID